ncbi:hypothetical protein [Ochrobactrum sp. Marseille-Q0166]|uniref:hypothetical protein n=1 Tax=Ochrobactrum sp. Marseille-Q0166 TaxID=2761105 RepID=UPI0016566EFF|nr:hypothetical protein [Ochrobactrum sp. Marseille-Q0166]MBC8718786.1 hypothetical protein [Ochrobactrum sp. Marseille-Q0166]
MAVDHLTAEAQAELEATRSIMSKPEGFIEHQLRSAFKDAARIYGFGGARQLTAEIMNDYAQRGR